jgi:hypothetical protein
MAIRVTRLGDFSQIELLLEAHYDFLKRRSRPKKWQHFGLLFAVANLLHFHLNKQFKNMVYCRYFKVSKVVLCRCLGIFKLSFLLDILAFFDLETFWATF